MSGCQYIIYAETQDPPQPAETCDRDVVEGTELCERHSG